MNASRAGGFTLLEAIVALVVFSIGSMALYGWLGTNLRTLERVQAGREQATLVRAGLDAVRHVNPMVDPSGGRDAGTLRVEWAARPLAPVRRSVTQVGVRGPFDVALYEMELRILRDGVEVHGMRVRQVGYRYAGGSAQDNDE
jgi:general secretion pathway protein I